MEFYIQKGAVLPTLKLQIVKDGINNHLDFMEVLQNAKIQFSMREESTGIYKILSNPSYIVEKIFDNSDAPDEYYIYYDWKARDTKNSGRYIGEFSIKTNDGVLIVPISEQLFINIRENF
jgi:hypothetical protein